MKPRYAYTLFLCLILISSLSFGAILTVDNTPANDAMYSSFGAAQAAASPGDTLLIQASPNSYGNIYVTKSLSLIGQGHDLASLKTLATCLRVLASDVLVEGIFFTTFGEACGTSLAGLCTGTTTSTSSSSATSFNQINGNNVIIRNCITRNSFTIFNGIENILFEGCILGYATPRGVYTGDNGESSFSSTAQNVIYKNCIINLYSLNSNQNTWLYQNNIIYSNAASNNGILFANQNATISNNVFYILDTADWNPEACAGCSFGTNLIFSPQGALTELPNSTLNNVAPTWELNPDAPNFFDLGSNYEMLSGAPATGASDGGQVGVYGLGYSFRMTGEPLAIPRVTNTAIINPVLAPDGSLQIEFQAEGDSN